MIDARTEREHMPSSDFAEKSQGEDAAPEARSAQAHAPGASRFIGVSKRKLGWAACVGNTYIATFDTEEQAAMAHDRAARGAGSRRARLNFPDRNLEPSTVEELRREARAREKRDTSSRFVGVSWDRHEQLWRAAIRHEDRTRRIGLFEDEETAARYYDAVAYKLKGDKARLNFGVPRRLINVDLPQPRQRCRYRGVRRVPTGSFEANVMNHETFVGLGRWENERDAAIAHDRGALALGLQDEKLNFPEESRALGPRSPADLRRDALLAAREPRNKTSSKYIGVIWDASLGKWVARATSGYKNTNISLFRTEREAAIARDRVWLHMQGDPSKLNFPDMQLEPASVDEIRKERWREIKSATTSRYRGVYWNRERQSWAATIWVNGGNMKLGFFDDEVKAAVAYDEAAKQYKSDRAHLNFPSDT